MYKEFDVDAIQLSKQLGLNVSTWDDFVEKIDEMNYEIVLGPAFEWVILDENKQNVAMVK